MKKKIFLGSSIIILLAIGSFFFIKPSSIFAKDQWTITQYGPRDINSSFYTIYNPKKGLIVVDGGWTEDAPYVREIIKSLDNDVDAWILTHPHQDHIGAFNEIYPDLQGIEIHQIYTVDMPTPEACKERATWDSIDTYNDFLSLDIQDIQYLYAGDTLKICDLNFIVYSSYGDYVEELSKDYINDGSMMFEVFGETESFLFCSDIGKSISDYLLDYWGEELQATYIQMGHHGYGGLNDTFYQTVNPQISFFDAPDWLMFDTTGKYDNPEHVKLMESLGSEIKSFNSAPNSIILH